jgi:hypothetical protein
MAMTEPDLVCPCCDNYDCICKLEDRLREIILDSRWGLDRDGWSYPHPSHVLDKLIADILALLKAEMSKRLEVGTWGEQALAYEHRLKLAELEHARLDAEVSRLQAEVERLTKKGVRYRTTTFDFER